MVDPRVAKFADQMVHYSLKLQPGEAVLLEVTDVPPEVVAAIVERIQAAGATPIVANNSSLIQRQLVKGGNEASLKRLGEVEYSRMAATDAYIAIRGANNVHEQSDVPPDNAQFYAQYITKHVHFDLRCARGRWVITRWPNAAMAQLAHMSTEAFTDFYFRAVNQDYNKLREASQPLVDLFHTTDKVHLKGPGTDLTLSIKGCGGGACCGTANLPDGEVCTVPVRESANGTIAYNVPTVYQGTVFTDIAFELHDGHIDKATGHPQDQLDAILDTDEGARYIGEFAIGLNPAITRPIYDILFDEKITGSLHFTPGGKCGPEPDAKRSGIHWDIVLMQDAEHGGGEIWFDDKLIRKDGLFVTPELEGLNPDKLLI